jgi:molybdopterin/thiamine biosynthesis adenylyltransferase
MSNPLHINPYRFRAHTDEHLILGAMDQTRHVCVNGEVAGFGTKTRLDDALAEALGDETVEGLREQRFLVPYEIDDANRVSRQLGFFSFWPEDPHTRQQRLERARIAILGVGTLGTQVGYLLAAAGVGELVLCDQDHVERSNLNRQMLFGESDIGRTKVEAAKDRLRETNPQLRVETHCTALRTAEDVIRVCQGADLIVRAVDFPMDIAFVIDDAAAALGIPHVGAGLLETWTMAGPFIDARSGSRLRDLVAPPAFERAAYRRIPVFGPTSFWIASYVAGDALRYFADLSEPWLHNRMMYLDGATGRMFSRDLTKVVGAKANSTDEGGSQ